MTLTTLAVPVIDTDVTEPSITWDELAGAIDGTPTPDDIDTENWTDRYPS